MKIELTQKEREFVYTVLNQVAIPGVDALRMKADVMEKMGIEKPFNKEDAKP